MTTKKQTHEEAVGEDRPVREGPEGETETVAEQAGPQTAGEAPESDRPAEDFHDKYLRLMADFQNFRKRSEKERTEVHAFANEKIITQLLGVLDNFERALQQESSDEAPFRDGMAMIAGQFRDVLVKEGLEEIKAVGEPFDPRLHHAILMDASGDAASGHVTEVLQKGYTFKGKLIRPAIVRVAE
jgi:molecular chaperone GrpE